MDIDTKISDCALDLGMAEPEPDRSQIARAPVDQGRFGPPRGMSAVHVRIKPDGNEPIQQKAGVLTSCHALPKTPTAYAETRPST